MLIKFFILFIQLCLATDEAWTVQKIQKTLNEKYPGQTMEFLETEFIGKVFQSSVSEEMKRKALSAWLRFAELPENRKDTDLENYTKMLLGSIHSRGGGMTPELASELASSLTIESPNTKVALEMSAAYPLEIKRIIYGKSFELLKDERADSSTSRKLAKDLHFYSNIQKNTMPLTKERAALYLKNEVVDEQIVNAALESKPYPIPEFLSALQKYGTYQVRNEVSDSIEAADALALSVFLGSVAAREIKLSERELLALKNTVLNKAVEPTRRELIYHTFAELSPETAKELMGELSKRDDVLEKYLVLDLVRDTPDFDKSRYFDLLGENALANSLVLHRIAKRSPNDLLARWLKRDPEGLIKKMSALEQQKYPLERTAYWVFSQIADEEGLDSVRRAFLDKPQFYNVLADLISKQSIPSELKKTLMKVMNLGESDKLPLLLLKEMNRNLPMPDAVSYDVENGRREVYEQADFLKKYLQRVPTASTKEFQTAVKEILYNPSVDLDAARTAIRKALSGTEKIEIEKEVAAKVTDLTNTDPCVVRCRLVRHFTEGWDKLKFDADAYYGNRDEHPWKLAVKAKTVEFLYQAGDDCGYDLREKIRTELSSNYVSTTPKLNSEINQGYLRTESNPSVSAFLNNVTALASDELPPSSPYIFSISHLGQLMNRINSNLTEAQKSTLKSVKEKTSAWLSKVNAKAHLLSDGNSMGSLLGTYHYSTLNLGYEENTKPEALQLALENMKAERALSLARYKSAQHIGYYLSFQKVPRSDSNEPAGASALSPSIRSASARMVPFNLVLYKNSSPEEKEKNAEYLTESLHNYLLYFQDNWSGRGENRTHEKHDQDLLAPYYGPSTISYVYDAISMMLKDKSLTTNRKNELRKLSEDISKQLLSKFQKDGLLIPQNEALYKGAKDYENAFAGLALHDACRIQKESAASNALLLQHLPSSRTLH